MPLRMRSSVSASTLGGGMAPRERPWHWILFWRFHSSFSARCTRRNLGLPANAAYNGARRAVAASRSANDNGAPPDPLIDASVCGRWSTCCEMVCFSGARATPQSSSVSESSSVSASLWCANDVSASHCDDASAALESSSAAQTSRPRSLRAASASAASMNVDPPRGVGGSCAFGLGGGGRRLVSAPSGCSVRWKYSMKRRCDGMVTPFWLFVRAKP
mmetsp:Transcript_14999/g.50305  ORF Transcript_14999/g.50305 Transcript_14999/m.50305 type:complete len:217 (-) Transcript_14999:583-1233(-)